MTATTSVETGESRDGEATITNVGEVRSKLETFTHLHLSGETVETVVENPRLDTTDPRFLRLEVPRRSTTTPRLISKLDSMGLKVADVWALEDEHDRDVLKMKVVPQEREL